MFEQTKPGLSRTWFEVVIVQRHDTYELGGRTIEAAETIPGSSTWGRLGWTYRDPKEARSRFDDLVKKANEKIS